MDGARSVVVIPPSGVGEVLDTGFNLARRNYRGLLAIAAWGTIPSSLIYTVPNALAASASVSTDAFSVLIIQFVGGLLYGLGLSVTFTALTIACARLVEPLPGQARITPAIAYRSAIGKLAVLFLLAILMLLPGIPLTILFPLGMYIYLRWSVASTAIMVEPIGSVEALRRSWNLTRSCWWHTFAVIFSSSLVIWILSIVMSGIPALGLAMIGLLFGSPVLGSILSSLAGIIPSILLYPFSAAILVVLYYELRARNEGFDLRQRGLQAISAA